MSSWFTLRLEPRSGSLATATRALAEASIAIESIIGTPESEHGEVHLAVAEADLERAAAALASLGLRAEPGGDGEVLPGDGAGLIGALLVGPRT